MHSSASSGRWDTHQINTTQFFDSLNLRDFSIDEFTDNSHVAGGHYSYTLSGATPIAESTSSYSSASIQRTSIGIQATPHLKTAGIQYKSHGVKNKLVDTGRYTSDHAVQDKQLQRPNSA